MRIEFANSPFLLSKKSTESTSNNFCSNPSKAPSSGVIPYLDIPKIAFSGNKIVRKPGDEADKLKKLGAMNFITDEPTRFNLEKAETPKTKTVQMFINTQDFMTNPKAELVTLSSVNGFQKGPESDRFKMSDRRYELAIPNGCGNFIYPPNTEQFDQVNTFALAHQTLQMYQDLLGRKINWAFPKERLKLYPHAGNKIDAFYDRNIEAIKLYHFKRSDNGKVIKTCRSSDIVCHETGHAILDGIKPSYWNSFGFGVTGYHEAFADTTAMLNALQNNTLMDRMLEMTNGDLRKENVIASIAEEFGTAINQTDYNSQNDNILYLRNAINFFKQKPYREMVYVDQYNEDTVLGLESHSYSRLYLGACYDVLTGLYEKSKPASGNRDEQKFALMNARDIFANDFARALDFAPTGEVDYKDMALAMIKADMIDFNGQNRDVIEKVFIDRNILTAADIQKLDAELKAMPDLTLPAQLKTPADIMQFISDNKTLLGVPEGINLNPADAYINSKGEKHIVCTYDVSEVLKAPDYGDSSGQLVNMQGGLSLTFDKENKLISKVFKEIDTQTKEDVLYAIKLLLVSASTEKANASQPNKKLKPLGLPELLSIDRETQLGKVSEIVKKPTISDPVDIEKRSTKSMAEYFNKLKTQINANK